MRTRRVWARRAGVVAGATTQGIRERLRAPLV